jgi:hypothetical protein
MEMGGDRFNTCFNSIRPHELRPILSRLSSPTYDDRQVLEPAETKIFSGYQSDGLGCRRRTDARTRRHEVVVGFIHRKITVS